MPILTLTRGFKKKRKKKPPQCLHTISAFAVAWWTKNWLRVPRAFTPLMFFMCPPLEACLWKKCTGTQCSALYRCYRALFQPGVFLFPFLPVLLQPFFFFSFSEGNKHCWSVYCRPRLAPQCRRLFPCWPCFLLWSSVVFRYFLRKRPFLDQ